MYGGYASSCRLGRMPLTAAQFGHRVGQQRELRGEDSELLQTAAVSVPGECQEPGGGPQLCSLARHRGNTAVCWPGRAVVGVSGPPQPGVAGQGGQDVQRVVGRLRRVGRPRRIGRRVPADLVRGGGGLPGGMLVDQVPFRHGAPR
jgi:hypothetical protein